VLPTLAALDAFPGQPVALIVGGQDRGIDYAELAEGVLARQAPTLVLTLPDSGPRISAVISDRVVAAGPAATGTGDGPPGFAGVIDCPDLLAAVSDGVGWLRSGGGALDGAPAAGGVVLLSPAAPSFGRFRDYRDRGDAFAAAMRELGGEPSP
jgi:UDP-N-acetylmuramoylalanine--D-glutamate ligase